jgi:hypothetical protein
VAEDGSGTAVKDEETKDKSQNGDGKKKRSDRSKAGVIPYAEMGYYQPDYTARRQRHPVRLPHHAAEGSRRQRGRRCSGR